MTNKTPMSMEELLRSLPTSPYEFDPRMERRVDPRLDPRLDPRIDTRDPRLMSAPFDTRLDMDGPDYFSPMGPMGYRSSGGSCPLPGLEQEFTMGLGSSQHSVDELVRR